MSKSLGTVILKGSATESYYKKGSTRLTKCVPLLHINEANTELNENVDLDKIYII